MEEVLKSDYQKHKAKMAAEADSMDRRLQKIEERKEECIFTIEHWKAIFKGKYKSSWRGLPLMKTPFEIITYQQMIWDLKPQTILEFGSNCGGSAIWMADIAKMGEGKCHVYSMDINQGLLEPLAKEKRDDITFIEGDCNKVEKVFPPELLKGLPHPWIVSEDAHVNVEAILEYLHQFMEPGDYVIVEDTNPFTPSTDDDGGFDFINLKGWGRWKLEVVIDFIRKHPDQYRIDSGYNDFFGYNVSNNMNSYIRRI
ncbi:uncharacterized protein LOC116293201 [Actinia tenebrosa]|uniref:Uncharacterized protein LOC116293201 n=1 Tax=Actinia tenebrosa TaxID=6105 RepID=A0A6P8HL28_ACTTE|nr:uncharacterized protein LOC116293201 [Actinia tenebrosa]XP_031556461.1 uncharacterized protein LOC116293201 [Actinia tenebrosa]